MPPSGQLGVSVLVAVVGLAGCVDDEPALPDISNLSVQVIWSGDSRGVGISVPQDIPCEGTESDLLGESGIQCASAPWTVVVDGIELETHPVECTSAHEGWFGYVDKYCTGGSAYAPLPDGPNEDVEIVVANDVDERRLTLAGVRKTYTLVEEKPLEIGVDDPGIVRVDGIELTGGTFDARFTPADGGASRTGDARAASDDNSRLMLELPFAIDAGVHALRVRAYVSGEHGSIAVPVEGTVTVAP